MIVSSILRTDLTCERCGGHEIQEEKFDANSGEQPMYSCLASGCLNVFWAADEQALASRKEVPT